MSNYQPSPEWVKANKKLGCNRIVKQVPEPKKRALARIDLQKCRDYENSLAYRINHTLDTILYHMVGEIKRQKAKGLRFVKIELPPKS